MNVQRHAQKLRRKVFEQKLVMCPLLDKTSFPCIAFPWQKYCRQFEKILNAGKRGLKIFILAISCNILPPDLQYGMQVCYAGDR